MPAFSPPPGLELEIRMRVAREKLAYDISLKLTEPAVPPELLDEARPFLHASHYDDVLEERSNDALCAFPCCSVRLPSFKPHQQFTLSRLGGAGRVLSTASAYRFCSTECARRSAQYARSLPLEPVAQRDTVGVDLQPKRALTAGERRVARTDGDQADGARPLVGNVRERPAGRARAQPPGGTVGGREDGLPRAHARGCCAGRAQTAASIEGFVPAEHVAPAAASMAAQRATGVARQRDDAMEIDQRPAGAEGSSEVAQGNGETRMAAGAREAGDDNSSDSDGAQRTALTRRRAAAPPQQPTGGALPGLSAFGQLWTALSAAATDETRRMLSREAAQLDDAGDARGGPGDARGARGVDACGGGSGGAGARGVRPQDSDKAARCEEEDLEAMLDRSLRIKARVQQGAQANAIRAPERAHVAPRVCANADVDRHAARSRTRGEVGRAHAAGMGAVERARIREHGPRGAELTARLHALFQAHAAAVGPNPPASGAHASGAARAHALLGSLSLEVPESAGVLSGAQLDVAAALLLELGGVQLDASVSAPILARAGLDEHHLKALAGAL